MPPGPETRALYWGMTTEFLLQMRAAFVADRAYADSVALCEGRLALIAEVLAARAATAPPS